MDIKIPLELGLCNYRKFGSCIREFELVMVAELFEKLSTLAYRAVTVCCFSGRQEYSFLNSYFITTKEK